MADVVWTEEALSEAIGDYFKQTSPQYAAALVDRLYSSVDPLDEPPKTGRKVPEVNHESLRERIISISFATSKLRSPRLCTVDKICKGASVNGGVIPLKEGSGIRFRTSRPIQTMLKSTDRIVVNLDVHYGTPEVVTWLNRTMAQHLRLSTFILTSVTAWSSEELRRKRSERRSGADGRPRMQNPERRGAFWSLPMTINGRKRTIRRKK